MIGQIDGYYVAAQIRLVRQVHKGAVLILEGDTDARVFDRFVDKEKCDIEVAFGKKNVLLALDLLEEDGFPGVVAVIDADFDRLLDRLCCSENLCVSDVHDLDLVLFSHSEQKRSAKHFLQEEAEVAEKYRMCICLSPRPPVHSNR